jgi:hypothetical protein
MSTIKISDSPKPLWPMQGARSANFVILCLLFQIYSATAGAVTLQNESTLQLNTSSISGTDLMGLGRWSHGSYIRLSKANRRVPLFYIFSSDGSLTSSFTFTVPDAKAVFIHSFDIAENGMVALCGMAYSDTGSAVPFIGIVSADHTHSKIVRTAPYSPFTLAISPQQTIWTMGVEMINGNEHAPGVNEDFDALRQFDSAGQLLTSSLHRGHVRVTHLTSGFIVVDSSRIGWYSPSHGKGVYIETLPDGSAPMHYPGMPGQKDGPELITGLVITQSGDVVLTYNDPVTQKSGIFSLDRSQRKWIQIPTPNEISGTPPVLAGSIGDHLLFVQGKPTVFRSFALIH